MWKLVEGLPIRDILNKAGINNVLKYVFILENHGLEGKIQ